MRSEHLLELELWILGVVDDPLVYVGLHSLEVNFYSEICNPAVDGVDVFDYKAGAVSHFFNPV